MQPANTGSVRPLGVYRDTFRNYGRYAPRLLAIGAVIFLPLALLETVVGRVESVDSATEDWLTIVAVLAVILMQVVFGLLGDVLYSGAVAVLVAMRPAHGPLPLGWVARRLSFGTLVAIDLAYNFGVGLGVALLVVPGVLVFTWFALAAPLVELEGLRFWAALGRSRALVRGRFWAVLAVLGPLTLAAETLDDAAVGLAEHLLGGSLVAEWLAEGAANIALSPLYALPAVLITLGLIGRPLLAEAPERI